MIQLTDEFIKSSFEKLGLDEKFFPFFDKKSRDTYDSLQQDSPDDDEVPEEDSNVIMSLRLASTYTTIYAKEIEKGHSDKWATVFANNQYDPSNIFNQLLLNYNDIISEAYNSIDSNEEKERELDIHINSLSDDPIFAERYKSLFHDDIDFALEKAKEYCFVYHRCIQEGKSEVYANAFANEINNYFVRLAPLKAFNDSRKRFFIDIHAEAVEQAINHGMNKDDAYSFGNCCSKISVDNSWFEPDTNEFLKDYHEDWQKEFYLYLANKDHKKRYRRDMPSFVVELLRNAVYNKEKPSKHISDEINECIIDYPDEPVKRTTKPNRSKSIIDIMFDRDEDFNDDDEGIGGILSRDN